MDVTALLNRVRNSPNYAGQIEHVEVLPERAGRYATPAEPLCPQVVKLLAKCGIEQLYTHQAVALDSARRGQDLVVVTGTASGKTLCYNLPIIEAALASSDAKALCLFPTKALAQDQLKNLLELVSIESDVAAAVRPGVYDGDTPTAQRKRIHSEANLVLTNPDMLHASVLPKLRRPARPPRNAQRPRPVTRHADAQQAGDHRAARTADGSGVFNVDGGRDFGGRFRVVEPVKQFGPHLGDSQQ